MTTPIQPSPVASAAPATPMDSPAASPRSSTRLIPMDRARKNRAAGCCPLPAAPRRTGGRRKRRPLQSGPRLLRPPCCRAAAKYFPPAAGRIDQSAGGRYLLLTVEKLGILSTYLLPPVFRDFLAPGRALTFHNYHSRETYEYAAQGLVKAAPSWPR